MKQISIIGNILGSSGYENHTRSLANALDKLVHVRLSCPILPGQEQLLTDREVVMLKRKQENDDINLIITLPNQWRLHTTNKRNWAYCIFEGDKVPDSFIDEFINPDIEKIIVASNHTKEAIIKTVKEIEELYDKKFTGWADSAWDAARGVLGVGEDAKAVAFRSRVALLGTILYNYSGKQTNEKEFDRLKPIIPMTDYGDVKFIQTLEDFKQNLYNLHDTKLESLRKISVGTGKFEKKEESTKKTLKKLW